MGGKSRGKSYVPKEAADNLQSAQIAEIIDLIGEGEIYQDIDLKRVYLNDTPVQNTNGTYNFSGIEFVGNKGVKDQNPLTGFDYVMRTVSVGTQVTKDSAIVRSITDPLVSRVVLTLGVPSLMQTTSKGDLLEASVTLLIEFIKDGKTVKSEQVTFKGKTTSQYYADDSYSDLPAAPFEIRVSRVTADSTTSSLLNDTYFSTYTEIIDAKLSYPHSVVVGIRADSAQFGNQIPSRKYLVKGLIIQVPTNYDPVNRTYSGVWDGQFKPSWTDNPAWVFYDLVTNTRYGLGKVLGSFTCDKWALYEIAKYCDELVDDGYGGKEPRMTCNLQLSDEREAYDILNDLASVFRGISIWNGRELTVVNDRVTDPVALYTNSNVVDGNFSRSFVAKRAITTVVHVAYQDKREQYRTKTEYVSDDELVKRYGENVKSVTAFGCTSRGQAVRLGRWILETSRLEQQIISFKVGAEGLQHIPYDVIQVADKFWANEVIGGRVMSVDGNRVTLDTQVGDVVGGTFTYLKLDGTNKSLNITGLSASRDVVTLSGVPEELSKGDVWSLVPANQVKPQLFRCLAIEENTEEGTYSVTAIEHNPAKGAMVDSGVRFDSSSTKTSNLVMKPVVYNPTVEVNGRELNLKFDSNALGSTLEYEFTVYKDGKVYLRTFKQSSPELNLSGLPNGVYIVKTRAKSEYGYSDYTEYGFTIDFNVTGLRTQPRTFAISLSWDWPDVVVSDLSVQLFYAKSSDFSKAVLLTTLPYPQTSYTLSGVGLSETYYFWARGVDAAGNQGQLTPPVQGQVDHDPNPIIEQITGAITKSTLGQELIAQLNSDMLDVASDAVALEAAARTQAIETEVANRTRDVKAASDKAAADLLVKATELGTRITNTETVNRNQATLISTVTAAQEATAAGLEEERRARADGDTAEAAKREALAAKVGQNEAAITTERNARVTANSAQAAETTALKSRVKNAESDITNLQSTFADSEKARADEVKTLSAKVGGGANLLPDSEFKYGLSKHLSREVNTATKVVGFNFSAMRTIEGKQVGYLKRSGAADSSTTILAFAKVPVEKGKVYQISCYVQQATSNVSLTNIYGMVYIGDVSQSTSAGAVVRTISNTPPTNGAATTLDQMYRCVRNYQIPLDSEITHIALCVSCGARTDKNDSYQFFTNPMFCEVGSLDAAPVPYSAGPDPENPVTLMNQVSAQLTEYKSAQATKDAATTDKLDSAVSRLGGAESKITNIETTKANKTEVASLARTTLKAEWDKSANDAARSAIDSFKVTYANDQSATAASVNSVRSDLTKKIDNISVGGRNLLLKSSVGRNTLGTTTYQISPTVDLSTITQMVLSVDIDVTDFVSDGGEYSRIGAEVQVFFNADGSDYAWFNVWLQGTTTKQTTKQRLTGTFTVPDGKKIDHLTSNKVQIRSATFTKAEVKNIKLEIGNISTDWTPAPEDSRDSFVGPNILPNSDFASDYDGWSMHNWNSVNGLTCGFNKKDSLFTYAMKDSKVFWVRDRRTTTGEYSQTLAQNTRNRFSVVPGDILQASVYVAGWGMKEPAIVYLDFFNLAGQTVTVEDANQNNTNGSVNVTLNGAQESPAEYTTLDRFHRIFQNVVVPPGAVYGQISIRFRFDPNSDSYGFFVQPQVCQISSLEMNSATPYQVSTNGLFGQIVETKTTAANIDGKVNSMYTLKVESAADGKKVVSGLMLGANQSESQFGVVADRFFVGTTQNGSMVAPFVVNTAGNNAKVVLKGDLIADGMILGRHIAASQTLTAPIINGGQINGGSLSIGDGAAVIDGNGNASFHNAYVSGYADIGGGSFRGSIISDDITGDVGRVYMFEPHDGYRAKLVLGSAPRPRIVQFNSWVIFYAQADEYGRLVMWMSFELHNNSTQIARWEWDDEYSIDSTIRRTKPDNFIDKYSIDSTIRRTKPYNFIDKYSVIVGRDTNGTVRLTDWNEPGWKFLMKRTIPPEPIIIPPNVDTTLWLVGGTIGGQPQYDVSGRAKFVETASNATAIVSYMSKTDSRYKSYFASATKSWGAIVDPKTLTSSGIEVVNTNDYRFYSFILLPPGISGVSFDYFGDGNRDWSWGVYIDDATVTYTVKDYDSRNHVIDWRNFSVIFNSISNGAVIRLQRSKGWQWLRIRNLKFYS